MSILNQYRQKRVVVSTEDDDTSTTGVVETPEVVINVENVEKLEVEATPDIEDAELVGEEKAEMVSSLENHIEETIEQVEEAEQAAEVLEEQADIMENLANSGDATPGAVQAAVSCAGLLINQLGVDIEEENADAPSAVETIVVSQESIAQDHVQALVVSMEGVKELARNIRNASQDNYDTSLLGFVTLFRSKQGIAAAIAKNALPFKEKVFSKFVGNNELALDITTFYDIFASKSNDGSKSLKTGWRSTLANNELVLGKGVDAVIAGLEKELSLITNTNFSEENAVEKLVKSIEKNQKTYTSPFSKTIDSFDDLGNSSLVTVNVAPSKKFINSPYANLVTFEVPARYGYNIERVAAEGRIEYKLGSAMSAAATIAGDVLKKSLLSWAGVVGSGVFLALEIRSQIKDFKTMTITPSMLFKKSDIEDAFDYLEKTPELITKGITDINKLKELYVQHTNALSSLAASNDDELVRAMKQRSKILIRTIINLINAEIKYILRIERRTNTFVKSIARFGRTTPSQESYDDSLVYSEEGFLGGLAGFLLTGSIPFGGTIAGIFGEAKIQKLRNQINEASDRIAKLRNGAIDEAVKQGTKLPADIKPIDKTAVIKAALWGTLFGPFYGMVKGSQLENENDKLMALIKELEVELKRAGLDINGQPIK